MKYLEWALPRRRKIFKIYLHGTPLVIIESQPLSVLSDFVRSTSNVSHSGQKFISIRICGFVGNSSKSDICGNYLAAGNVCQAK